MQFFFQLVEDSAGEFLVMPIAVLCDISLKTYFWLVIIFLICTFFRLKIHYAISRNSLRKNAIFAVNSEIKNKCILFFLRMKELNNNAEN